MRSVESLVDLSSYGKGKLIIQKANGKEYAIRFFGSPHENEYCVQEWVDGKVKGKCQLFEFGVLKLEWQEEDDKRVGVFSIFRQGKMERQATWTSFDPLSEEIKEVRKDDGHRLLEIRAHESNKLIYRGEYNERLERHGKGVVFDSLSGEAVLEGYFKNDELFHISRHVVESSLCSLGERNDIIFNSKKIKNETLNPTPHVMIEYGGDYTENNNDIFKRRPIYIGGYAFCDEENMFLRHGDGKILNEFTGICEKEGVWENGHEQSSKRVNTSMNSESIPESESEFESESESESKSHPESKSELPSEWDKSLRMIAYKDFSNLESGYWSKPITLFSNYTVRCGVNEISIPPNFGNESEITTLIIRDLPLLDRLFISNDCFHNVRCIKLLSMASLKQVTIGMDCFKKGESELGDGEFVISNCSGLCDLSIGDGSFFDYTTFTIQKCNSVKTIRIGGSCFYYASQFELKRSY